MAAFSRLSEIAVLRQAAMLVGLWLVLTGADIGSLVVGFPAVLLATLASRRLVARKRVNFASLLAFLPFFLLRSLAAAFDVARRTFAPRLLISPGLVSYDISLRQGLSRVVFMNTVSLLPGTLSAALEDDRLTVHVLDAGRDHPGELARLEKIMARIFPVESCD